MKTFWLLFATMIGGFGHATAQAQTAGEAPYHFALGKILIDEGNYLEAGENLSRAVAAAPQDPYLRIEYADFLLNSGDVAAAAEELEIAKELAPRDPVVLKALGRLQLQAARERETAFPEARAAFEILREMTPEDLDAMSTLGRIYLSEQRYAEAADVLRQALAYWPQNRVLHGSLIDALLRGGSTSEAEKAIGEFLLVEPTSIRARLTLSDLLRKKGDLPAAATVLAETPRESAAETDLYRRLAGALYELESFAEALYWLDRSLERGDLDATSDPQDLFLRALLLTAEGRHAEARTELERILEVQPTQGDALQLLVRHLFGSGEWQEVADLLAPRLSGELDDSNGELALLYAEALRQLDRGEEALDWLARAAGRPKLRERALARQAATLLALERGLEADEVLRELTATGSRESLLMAAEVCQREESYARSVPFLEKLIADGYEELQALFWLGAAYERTGRESEAEDQFRSFLEREPDSAPALNYLGYMWAESGENLDEALELIERAVALDPDNGAYVDSLGWAHFQLGNYEEARVHLERAASLVGDDAIVLEHLGDVYSVLGERGKAARTYRRALDLKAENANQVMAKLRQLDSP